MWNKVGNIWNSNHENVTESALIKITYVNNREDNDTESWQFKPSNKNYENNISINQQDVFNQKECNEENIEYKEKIISLEKEMFLLKKNHEKETDRLKEQIVELMNEKYTFIQDRRTLINKNNKLHQDYWLLRRTADRQIELYDECMAKLQDTEQRLYEALKEKSFDDIMVITKQHDVDDEDDNDEDEKKADGDTHDLFDELLDDELCQKLQDDLENYMVDQKKRKKHPLKELQIFHENKAQIIRNWDNLLYRNYFKSLWEILVDKLEDKYDDDIDAEKIAYNILFDIVIECYDILHTEHNKIQQNEYMNPKVIDIVLMNIVNFYDLMRRNKLKGRIVNIYEYINNKIDEIYKIVQQNHAKYMNEDKNELCQFMVNCCQIIWSVLHYDVRIYPLNFSVNRFESKYNDKIHENDGDCHGYNIKHYIFPALKKKDSTYQTKMWVICNDIE